MTNVPTHPVCHPICSRSRCGGWPILLLLVLMCGGRASVAAEQKPADSARAPAKESLARPSGKRIVFVIDASGSMLHVFASARQTLLHQLDQMDEGQEFAIILDGEPRMAKQSSPFNDGKSLLKVSKSNCEAARAFLQAINVNGADDPAAAIKRACDLKPDTVVYLTDGSWQGDADAVLTFCARMAAGRKLHMHVIACTLDERERELPSIDTLKKLARTCTGLFGFADEVTKEPEKAK